MLLSKKEIMTTLQIPSELEKKISVQDLEKLLQSEDFEDILFWYQMQKAQTWDVISYDSMKAQLWL